MKPHKLCKILFSPQSSQYIAFIKYYKTYAGPEAINMFKMVIASGHLVSFFLIEVFHLWFSYIACPQNLQIIDIEDQCWLICLIFVDTCAVRSKNLPREAN